MKYFLISLFKLNIKKYFLRSRLFFTTLTLFFIINFLNISPNLSASEITSGWKNVKTRTFKANNLYGHIDGGAEVFLELGFKDLSVENYSNGKDEIIIEKYLMDSPEAALAIYLIKCGKEKPISKISYRNTGDKYQIIILKGDHYIQIINPKGKPELQKDMVELSNSNLAKIQNKKPSDLFSILPATGRIKGTQYIFRGPYSLQSIYTFGDGDPLSQKNKIFGVTCDYKSKSGKIYTKIMIKYPDNNYAFSAFGHLVSSLDQTKKIIKKESNLTIFKDHAGKFSIIKLDGNILDIDINLNEQPK